MSAPTTAEVRDEIADTRRHGRGAAQAGHVLALETWALPLAEHRDALAAEVARLREALAASEARAAKAEGVIAEALAVTEGMCGQPRATLAFALAGVRMALTSAAKGAGR